MKCSIFLILIATCAFVSCLETEFEFSPINDELKTENTDLKITLYYETLCPFCHKFIINQLYPTYSKLEKYIRIQMIPYGNASRYKKNGKWFFECQHGPNECFGNAIHSCILNEEISFATKLNYIYCLSKHRHSVSIQAIQTCGRMNGVPFQPIIACGRGPEGNYLLAAMGQRSDQLVPPLDKVPTIAFNNKYNSRLDDDARKNLTSTVCSLLPSGVC